jgi:Flp pilus assembly protein TadD
MQLGTAAAVRGDYARAEALLREAVDADPGLAEAHLNLGRVCDRTGRPDEALRHYEAGLALVDRPAERQPAVVARVRQLRH